MTDNTDTQLNNYFNTGELMICPGYSSLFIQLSFDVSIKRRELNSEKDRHESRVQRYEVDVEIAV